MAQWNPSEEYIENTRLYKWMQKLGYSEYDLFHQQSINDVEWFWRRVEKELGIPWLNHYDRVLDVEKGIQWPKWYVNGKLNAYELALGQWAKDPIMTQKEALIWEGEDGEVRRYTFSSLATEVNKVAAGLKKLDVKRGDVVALYMPMIPETIMALMAVSKIGAIFTPVFSGYGQEAIATRIAASRAKLVITVDSSQRKGKEIMLKDELDKALLNCPEVESVVVVRRTKTKAVQLKEKHIAWEELLSHQPCLEIEPMNSDEPLMLLYTSGTTGKPKGTVHTHSGFPIKAGFDAGICMDLKRQDTLFWYTDMGWMMGPFLVYGGWVNGATIMLYEGSPDFPNADRLWQLIDRYHISHLGISPTLIRSLMRHGDNWLTQKLSSLRVIASTGEPWNDDAWYWLFEKVGKEKIPIFNYTGGTEIAGGILGNVLVRPIKVSMFNAALPGMSAYVADCWGNQMENQVGELVLTKPWVGMTNGFWEQPKRYLKTYWSRWPNMWIHGDWAITDEDGYWKITGRSDDIINVAGKRVGPSEVETILASHHYVHEAGAIGIPDHRKGDALICFAVLQESIEMTNTVKETLLDFLSVKLGKSLRPNDIHFISDLPKTKNGKVMRRLIKNAYLHLKLGDISSIENPNVLDEIAQLKRPGQKNL
ncbi:AMP-binding protein [Halalkalibacter krulwichiae]|uniref:acetate--CoA ligase n=1 Tax=Halalkalibacter krulwichiae TaxID=199441 RepID=A0A1X9M6U4_9BACI|nr:AMP-binding protein [Halalkalibacter krulwichiae]ARK29146.1 Acetyl-coenzyme A synthetase [Halalkalibacter krulwichiae]